MSMKRHARSRILGLREVWGSSASFYLETRGLWRFSQRPLDPGEFVSFDRDLVNVAPLQFDKNPFGFTNSFGNLALLRIEFPFDVKDRRNADRNAVVGTLDRT